MMKTWLKRLLLLLVAALVIIQFIPAGRTNPPVTAAYDPPPEVAPILRESCMDCHSHETRWPWYAYVAPLSWWLVEHVEHGREHLNFSTWEDYLPERKHHKLEELIEETEDGAMPLPSYMRMHGEARLSADELEALHAWARAEMAALKGLIPEEPGGP